MVLKDEPGGGGTGYRIDSGTLPRVRELLRGGASALEAEARRQPGGPDAGAASGPVELMLEMLASEALVLADDLDTIAGKVDSADGSYAEVENDNAGLITYQEKYLDPIESPGTPGPTPDAVPDDPEGPLQAAPDDQTAEDRAGVEAPEPAPAPPADPAEPSPGPSPSP